MTTDATNWDDTLGVVMSAETLGVSEFEVFRCAYESWYDHSASDAFIEDYFVPYMFHGEVPFWVRSFIRHALGTSQIASASDAREPTFARRLSWLLDLSLAVLFPSARAEAKVCTGAWMA